MINIPNIISLLRFPLAFLFLSSSLYVRTIVIILAMLSDFFDGYFARRYQWSSKLGTLLDPIMDKFFVCFVLAVLIQENQMTVELALVMLSRDFAVLIYGVYLGLRRRLTTYQFRAIWSGKVTTTLQFAVFLAVLFGFMIPSSIYFSFILLGCLALLELYLVDHSYIII